MKIEDYGLIGDTHTAALVGKNGSIDWLCLPRFDSGACFAALLGEEKNGFWQLSPAGEVRSVEHRYLPDSLVLETTFETADGGCVRVVDCMPPRREHPHVVRLVEGVRGRVKMRMRLAIRYDYGSVLPWVKKRQVPGELQAVAGPDALILRTHVETRGEGLMTIADFEVSEDECAPFVLSWHPSQDPPPAALDAASEIEATERWWREWAAKGNCQDGEWSEAIKRSLITLKALTYAPTGGIVAAPTTSLPEQLGGERNWDYRFCWLRDASFTLDAMLGAGYTEEASQWRDWLLRAIGGDPAKLQILYGLHGERRLEEYELPELSGYEDSRPVRIGNAASGQFQLDVYGETIDTIHRARDAGLPATDAQGTDVKVAATLLEFLESAWSQPDDGIWEVRGERRHFTYSKIMAWVAVDRLIARAEKSGITIDSGRWKRMRDTIHREVCEKGYNEQVGAFTQYYGSTTLDASILRMALVGFLPPDDPRVRSTVAAVEKTLLINGFVQRYLTDEDSAVDGLSGDEGAFLPCTFWLADNYCLQGRHEEARATFERLLGLTNRLGLMSEEYDIKRRRLIGNFPQAFSHVALVNTALRLRAKHG